MGVSLEGLEFSLLGISKPEFLKYHFRLHILARYETGSDPRSAFRNLYDSQEFSFGFSVKDDSRNPK
jgi:hypothetical protein